MISNPDLVFYACIAKGTIVIAEYTSKEEASDIEDLALKCIKKTPPYHTNFSHTVKKRAYTFFIEDPFVCFGIFHEDLPKSEALWFLNRVKCEFEASVDKKSIVGDTVLTPLCFQSQMGSVFRESLAPNVEFVGGSLDLDRRQVAIQAPLLGGTPLLAEPTNGLKKKRRVSVETNGRSVDGKDVAFENKLEVGDDHDGLALKGLGSERQNAKQIWMKHVWIVLLLDLFVCAVLFGIWLWVCRGFQCMDG